MSEDKLDRLTKYATELQGIKVSDDDPNAVAYLRPETAQSIFSQFKKLISQYLLGSIIINKTYCSEDMKPGREKSETKILENRIFWRYQTTQLRESDGYKGKIEVISYDHKKY